jgi:hypothetical protein
MAEGAGLHGAAVYTAHICMLLSTNATAFAYSCTYHTACRLARLLVPLHVTCCLSCIAALLSVSTPDHHTLLPTVFNTLDVLSPWHVQRAGAGASCLSSIIRFCSSCFCLFHP